jgi:imidazolonepropionase-like amidohydrolase
VIPKLRATLTWHQAAAVSVALLLLVALTAAPPAAAQVASPAEPIVLIPDRVFDGRGGVVEGRAVVLRSGRIERLVDAEGLDEDLNLRGVRRLALPGLSLLPGLIDTHVHIAWSFGLDGRTLTAASPETVEQRVLLAAENAARTLRGGVTTVQSLGDELDLTLRDMIARGNLAGPRILTSAGAITDPELTPEDLRAAVRDFAQRGADVIKVFASASIRVGGTPTLSQEQLDAICGEARAAGLRTVVHAHSSESARRVAMAGCTGVEHGALLDRATLELLAERGVFYDPNIDLVLRNYFENEERFLGVGSYTAEGFAQMRAAVPKALETFRTALTVEGLRMVFGTDALAGAHGRNVEELIYRIERGGQPVLDAITSATSLAAESLDMGSEIGTVAPGFVADLIAIEGDPRQDPAALSRVRLVLENGRVSFRD